MDMAEFLEIYPEDFQLGLCYHVLYNPHTYIVSWSLNLSNKSFE